MPEVPGLVIEDSGRGRSKSIAKRVIAQEGPCGTNVLGGSELHELAEQTLRTRERLGGGLPPDVPLCQRQENVSTHLWIISSEIEGGMRCSRPLLRGGHEEIAAAAVARTLIGGGERGLLMVGGASP
jgi:hypothetical protein